MNSIRIKTFAITVIALLAAPTSAFAQSSGSGYSPPGGDEPQLAFTGRDLYLWAGLGLLLVGVGLGLRRLTAGGDDAKHRAEVASGDGGDAAYGSTETAGTDQLHVPASVRAPEPTEVAEIAPAAIAAGEVEPTVIAAAIPLDSPPVREPLPSRRERGGQRGREVAASALPAVPVVRPRDRSRLALEHGFAQALVQAGDERGLLEVAAAHVAGALDGEGASVLAREDDARGPKVLARAGTTADGIDRADGAAASALVEGRVVRRSGAESGYELAAPIHVDGRVWGVVAAESSASFTEGDSELAGALAAQVGQALTAEQLSNVVDDMA